MMKTKLLVAGALVLSAVTLAWFFREPAQPERYPHKISGAYEALNFWSFQRAYPNKSIPDVAHYAAFEYSRRSLQRRAQSFTVDPWEAIGPHNLGGAHPGAGV